MTTVLITGSTDGIGLRTAHTLSTRGCDVIVHGRDPDKVDATRADVGAVAGLVADLGDLQQVQRLADQAAELSPDVLINNAGIYARDRILTPSGEATWVVNHLAASLLADSLIPTMPRGGRVVYVSSIAHGRADLDLEDPEFVTVAGDLVMGHWEYSSDGRLVFGPLGNDTERQAAIRRASDFYYDHWLGRFDPARNPHLAAALQSLQQPLVPMTVHVLLGDHELGDNNWPAGGARSRKCRYPAVVHVTSQLISANFSCLSQAGVVQISLAWAETDQGSCRRVAAYRPTEAGVCKKCT